MREQTKLRLGTQEHQPTNRGISWASWVIEYTQITDSKTGICDPSTALFFEFFEYGFA
jgi:hypothetical protein